MEDDIVIRDFGRAARELWSFGDGDVPLNHGSFGACPLDVRKAYRRLLRQYWDQPEEFFRRRVMPDNAMADVRSAAREIATLIGTSENQVALVENATAGIQTVLQSIPFRPGDQILITDHQYQAVRFAVEQRCRETGATPLIASIPIPLSSVDVTDKVISAANPKVRLAIVDHITSATAIVFPIREIVSELNIRKIPVLVDGAHAIGQIPLDVDLLNADWYVSNAHKWLYAPPGCAFLQARKDRISATRCLITSHFAGLGFPRSFDYVGTRDYTNWLTIPAAVAFHKRLDTASFRAHIASLLSATNQRLIALGATLVDKSKHELSMRSYWLPQRRSAETEDADVLRNCLWRSERIQIGSNVHCGKLLVRVSAQAYVDLDDVTRLAKALHRYGWPGR